MSGEPSCASVEQSSGYQRLVIDVVFVMLLLSDHPHAMGLREVAGVGEKKATSLLASATEWVAQHPTPQPVSEAEAAAGEAAVETEPEGQPRVEDRAESAGEGSTAEHPPRASAG